MKNSVHTDHFRDVTKKMGRYEKFCADREMVDSSFSVQIAIIPYSNSVSDSNSDSVSHSASGASLRAFPQASTFRRQTPGSSQSGRRGPGQRRLERAARELVTLCNQLIHICR